MLDSNVVRATIARLRAEGWHYERDLLTEVAPYQTGDVVEALQVMLLAECIRATGEGDKKRYRWIK